jgi:hypothetical protein
MQKENWQMPAARKSTLDSMTANTKAGDAPADDPDDVIPQGGPQAVYSTEANFDPKELSTARLSIAQALHPDVRAGKVREGQLVVTGMPPTESVILVVAGHTPQRRFIEAGQQQARCYSVDAVVGIGDPGIACAECPFSKWTDSGKKDKTGKTINVRPPCDEVDSFLCYSVTHGMPLLWNLKGTAKQSARFLKTLATGLGFGNFAIEVTAETRSNGGNVWQVPKVVLANEGLSPEECQAYAMIARSTVKTAGAITAQAEA